MEMHPWTSGVVIQVCCSTLFDHICISELFSFIRCLANVACTFSPCGQAHFLCLGFIYMTSYRSVLHVIAKLIPNEELPLRPCGY